MPVWGGDVAAAGVQQPPPPENKDQRHAFVVAISRPKPRCDPFPRSVVFLLDRSGAAQISSRARTRHRAGLKDLGPNDKFNMRVR